MSTQTNAVPDCRWNAGRAPGDFGVRRLVLVRAARALGKPLRLCRAIVGRGHISGRTFGRLTHLPGKTAAVRALDAAKSAGGNSATVQHVCRIHDGDIYSGDGVLLLGALHGERRDRSILFWKSLPVSDLTTVLAKASIPFVILPLLTWRSRGTAVGDVAAEQRGVAGERTERGVAVGAFAGVSDVAATALSLVTAHALWPAPVYCWLLLVSGWARRAAFLWAALPVLAIAGVEAIAFHTRYFATLVANHLIGNTAAISFTSPDVFPTDPMTHISPAHFLLSAGLWIGLAMAAAFLAAAVRIRRYREPM